MDKDKLEAIEGYKERFRRIKDYMPSKDLDLAIAILIELGLRPTGEWMTALDKHLRRTERILGISRKGNKSKYK